MLGSKLVWSRGLAVAVLLAACGDSGGSGATEGVSSSTTATTSTSSTTTGPGTTGVMTSTTGPGTTGPATSTSTGSGSSSTTTGPAVCDVLPPGPFMATPAFKSFQFGGSEDLAFDGQGNMVAKQASTMVMVTADEAATALAANVPDAYGVRYLDGGNLLVAAYKQQEILQIDSSGTVSSFVGMVGGVNGLAPDFDGNVWFTNISVVGKVDSTGTASVVIGGADGNGANGIAYDKDRMLVFFDNSSTGVVRKFGIDGNGNAGSAEIVTTIAGAMALDGMTLDACGNLYVVDQGASTIYRVWLDADGNATGDAEELLDAPTADNISNVQFAVGDGWDPKSLYAIGTPGTVYTVGVGVGGAPYPLPQ